MLKRIGGTESPLKQGAAWLAEKLGRLKLNDSLVSYSELSRLLELEGLCEIATGATATNPESRSGLLVASGRENRPFIKGESTTGLWIPSDSSRSCSQVSADARLLSDWP